jgi:uncharacterized protein (DUF1778 family)
VPTVKTLLPAIKNDLTLLLLIADLTPRNITAFIFKSPCNAAGHVLISSNNFTRELRPQTRQGFMP